MFDTTFKRFMKAVHDGNLAEVEACIQKGVNVNKADKSGATALSIAIESNNQDIFHRLLRVPGIDLGKNFVSFHPDLLYFSKIGKLTYFILAAALKRNDMAIALIQHGADISSTLDKTPRGYKPIQAVAYFGNDRIVEELLNAGLNIHNDNKVIRNAIALAIGEHFQSLGNYNRTVQLLLAYPGYVPNQPANSKGDSFLYIAASKLKCDLIRPFIEHGENPNEPKLIEFALKRSYQCAYELFTRGANPNIMIPLEGGVETYPLVYISKIKDDYEIEPYYHIQTLNLLLATPGIQLDIHERPSGETALTYAIKNNKPTFVQNLLAIGASVEEPGANGELPIDLVNRPGVNPHITHFVTTKYNQINVNPNTVLPDGQTLFIKTIREGNLRLIQSMIRRGANVNFRVNEILFTPLHYATSFLGKTDNPNVIPIIQALLDAGADINAKTITGYSPISFSFSGSRNDVIDYLMRGRDINEMFEIGTHKLTALQIACINKAPPALIFHLLEKGVDPNKTDVVGNSALSWAVKQNCHPDVIQAFIDNGKLRTGFYRIAFKIAIEQNNTELVKKLAPKIGFKSSFVDDAGNQQTYLKYSVVTAANNNNFAIIKIISQQVNLIEIYNDLYKDCLMFNNYFLLKSLLKLGLEPDGNVTYMPIMIYANECDAPLFAFRLLRDYGANLDVQLNDIPLRNRVKPDIAALLQEPFESWSPVSRDAVFEFNEMLSTQFEDTTPIANNVSCCPVCLTIKRRSVGCMYMHHNCTTERPRPYVNQQLYDKFKTADGNIWWCTICGRICQGHRHFALSEYNSSQMPKLLPGVSPFDNDCSVIESGGGLVEKIARTRALREQLLYFTNRQGRRIHHNAVQDDLIEANWNAPLISMDKAHTVLTNRAWDIPDEQFPEVAIPPVPAVAPPTAPNYNDPTAYEAPVVLNVGDAGYEQNNVAFNDTVPIIKFIHKKADGSMHRSHPQIGLQSLIGHVRSSADGRCFDADCGGKLWPREIEQALASPILAPSVTDEMRTLIGFYKQRFNQLRPAVGGRRTQRQRRHRRRTRKQ